MQFATAGTYNVKIKTTDDCGKTKNATRQITVKDKPVHLYFETNGGTNINPITIEKGDTYTLYNAKTTKPDWLFDGWFDNPELTGTALVTILMDSDKTVYAKWVEDRYKTYVFSKASSKTLGINVPETQLDDYIAVYGDIVATYDPWTEDEPYNFQSANDQPWKSHASTINRITVGQTIAPATMDYWFTGLSAATIFDGVTNIDTSELISLKATFKDCTALDNVDLSTWTTPKLENMQMCFMSCKNFNNWILGFDTKWVEDFSYAFADVKARNEDTYWGIERHNFIDIASFNFTAATTLAYMFSTTDVDEIYFCRHFAESDNMRNVTSFNSMFSRTTANAIFSQAFTFGPQTITDNFMFGGAYNLVGGAGTVYDETHINKDYAHPDGGISNPGYFRESLFANITFELDGGDPITPNPMTFKLGEEAQLPRATKTDKQLEGWYRDSALTQKAGTGFVYTPSMVEETLYAKWQDPQPEKTHYLFVDNTLILGVPDEELDYQISLHGNVVKQYENDPGSLISIFESEKHRIDHVLCGAPKVILQPTRGAFKGFSNLMDASISSLVGDPNVDNGRLDLTSMFESCGIMSYCDAAIDGETIKYTTKMFYQCFQLNTVYVPKAKVTGDGVLEACDYMFASCRALRPTIDLSDMEFDYTRKMNHMFHDCQDLQEITFPEFMNTQEVEELQNIFADCFNLERINNSRGFNTKSTKYLTGMFANTRIETIDLTGVDTTRAISVSGMFNNCQQLTTIYVSEDFIMRPNITNTSNVFANCPNLVGQNGTTWNSTHKDDGYMMWIDGYEGTDGYFTKGVLPYAYAEYDSVSKELRFFRGQFDKYQDREIIGDKRYFTQIEQISNWELEWPADLKADCVRVCTDGNVFKLRDAACMFLGFEKVEGIELQNFEYRGETMERMFMNCSRLGGVEFGPAWDVTYVNNINHMFYGCSQLTKGDFAFLFNGWTPVSLRYAQCAFFGCRGTDELDLSTWNLSNLRNTEEMFAMMAGLHTIYVNPTMSFDLSMIDEWADMFNMDLSLVGGNGTAYDANYAGKERAVVDSASTPGYLTAKV